MIVMAFLKMAADLALLYIAAGPLVYGCGVGTVPILLTLVSVSLAFCLSFLLREKKALKYVPYLLAAAPALFAGDGWIPWLVLAVISTGYAVYCTAGNRFLGYIEERKTVFKVTWVVLAVALLLALVFSASEEQFMLIVVSGVTTVAGSVLLMRSLRHDPAVYNSMRFQAVNIGIILVILGLSLLLSSKGILAGVLAGLKAVYTAIATGFVYVVIFILEGINYVASWIKSLFGEGARIEAEPVEINMDGAKELFGDLADVQTAGFPQWLKIVGIVILAAALLLVIILILRKLAGSKTGKLVARTAYGSTFSVEAGNGRIKDQSPSVQGVRKQYKNYLLFLKKQGAEITADKTTGEIEIMSDRILAGKGPENGMPKCTQAEEELRKLYLEARYNGTSQKADAERAKELVGIIKKFSTK